jgi:hypothetical protein
MTVNPDESIVVAINRLMSGYFEAQTTKPDARSKCLLAISAVQTLQRAFTHTKRGHAELQQAFASLLSSAENLSWNSVNFPIANTLLSQTYADLFTANNVRDAEKHSVLVSSLFTFLAVLESNPELATESLLRQLVEDGIRLQTAPAPAPELNYRANILQIFNPGNVAAVDLEPLLVIVYTGVLAGGGSGPELWGLAYIQEETAHVLLETGEYITTPADSLVLAATKDYDTSELPPYLLACAKLFMPIMLSQLPDGNSPQMQEVIEKLSRNFGSFTASPHLCVATVEELAECKKVIDSAHAAGHDTAAKGAMKMFDVPDSDMRIMVTAQQASNRPYITSTLVHANAGTIFMRLDVPREFSARGVYLFPLNGKSSVLIVV